MPGTLYVVATPIGNLEDVTVRALRTLKEVAVIAAEDTRRTAHLLARYAITTPSTSLHAHNEGQKTPALVARLLRGDSVALVSDAGTPLISDPGQHLVKAAIAAGIRVEPIPGPSAIMATLSAAGVETGAFSFLGFPPTRSKDRKEWFDRVNRIDHTVVFFEAPHRIRRTLEQLAPIVRDCPAVVCRELTKIHEEFVRRPISAILAEPFEVKGEVTVVLELGLKTNIGDHAPHRSQPTFEELGHIIELMGVSRRAALAELGRRHHMTPNQVYRAIEKAKKSAE
jgi:16S rRNA (cytidine1402-2'-O)-methyltransferase